MNPEIASVVAVTAVALLALGCLAQELTDIAA